jgi:hypothetical protein
MRRLHRVNNGREMFRHLPFPFDNDRFPSELGAVVQQSVLTGEQPAREVIHAPDGSWIVGDGVNDPNLSGASVATHLAHAIERNSSIAELADMPPGHIAQRSDPGEAWTICVLEGWDD